MITNGLKRTVAIYVENGGKIMTKDIKYIKFFMVYIMFGFALNYSILGYAKTDTLNITREKLFTKEELEYIQDEKVITVGNLPNRAPLSSYNKDTEEVWGVNEDILMEIEQISGLKLKLEAIADGQKPISELKNKKFDIVAGIVTTNNFLNDTELIISDSFLSSNVVPIVKKGSSYDPSKDLTIAIPSTFQALDEYIEENYPYFKVVYYDDNYKCLQAVVDKEVDVTMQNEYLINYQLQNPHYSDLEIVRAYFFKEKSAIAFRADADPLLVSIVNKSINALDKDIVSQIVVANTGAYQYKHTLSDIIYMYKTPLIVIVLLVVFCIGLLAVVIAMRQKNISKLTKKNEELEETMNKLQEAKAAAEDAMYEAEKSNRAKSTFLSRMSHEIRTPMNAIIGLTALAKKYLEDNPIAIDYLDKITLSSKTLLNIINDVLDMSAIESDKIKIGNNPFDFKELLSEITAMYYTLCKQKGIKYDLYLSGVTEEVVIGDSLRVNQILNNLLSNSLKFTNNGGTIKLIVSQDKIDDENVYMKFSVVDTGCGMSEDMQKRLFKPFEQEDTKTALEHGGSGLGLSITKNLVNMMRGSIEVNSKKDIGTTFAVSVPFKRSDAQVAQAAERFKRISALIIDDDINTREYISCVLDRIGVSHDCVSSGMDALSKLKISYDKGKGYDVCFVDWKMPDMDGITVTEKIRELFDEDTLIIIISAYDLNEVEDEAKEKGANMFLPKPLFQSTVFDVLMTLTGSENVKVNREDIKYNFKGHRVMLVDDTAFNLEVAVDLLEETGLTVTCANNGKEAYDLFIENEPETFELILMDIQMPVMNGHDATRAIRNSTRQDAKTIPIVAMTANAFTEDITESFTAGMNDHLTKPIDTEVLYKTLKRFLNKIK